MDSDVKRIVVAAALAAAAFNATAPAQRVLGGAFQRVISAADGGAADGVPVRETQVRPNRVRIARCGEDAPPAPLRTI